MMVLLFGLLLLCVLIIWIGWHKLAITTTLVTLVLLCAWFSHHVTSALNIQL